LATSEGRHIKYLTRAFTIKYTLMCTLASDINR
jgi:hypothetical protein